MDITEGLLAGTVLAVAVAAFARTRGWGIALPVLAVGVLTGLLPFGPAAPSNAGEIFLIILAPLIFGEALSSSYLDLRRVGRLVLTLAIGLVVFVALAVGAVATWIVPQIPWAVALALGAILAPTDAVAVAAVAKRARLPRRIVTVLEGESLVNDGSGLTLLRVALVSAAAGSVTAAEVAGVLALSVLGGVGLGAIVGLILVWVIRRSRDPLVANAVILLAPFPAYFLAEAIEGSGILAVVVAALITAHAMSADSGFRGRPQSIAAWGQITFLLQAFAFFLIGIELPSSLSNLREEQWPLLPWLVLAVLVTLIVTRFAFAGVMWAITRRMPDRTLGGRAWSIVGWAGARGPVSGLAAFSLPFLLDSGSALPDRNLLLATSLCVIVATLLLSPTLGPLARWLKLTEDDDDAAVRTRLRHAMAMAALERLDGLADDAEANGTAYPDSFIQRVRASYESQLTHDAPATASNVMDPTASRRVLLELLNAQSTELLRQRDLRSIPDSTIKSMQHDLDLQQQALRARPPS